MSDQIDYDELRKKYRQLLKENRRLEAIIENYRARFGAQPPRSENEQ